MVEGLPLDAFFQLGGAAFGVRAAGADHLVNVSLRKFQPALDDLAADDHFIQCFLEPLIAERLDEVIHRAQPQCILNVGRIVGGGDENGIGIAPLPAQFGQQFHAGHFRHIQIQQQ